MGAFGFLICLAVAWTVAWFTFIRPKLAAYHATAGILAQLDAREKTTLGWLGLKLQGLKTVLLLFVTSMLTGASSAIQSLLGLDPAALTPFQDSTIWKALVQDEMAIKAAALATFASALLVLHGKLKDVRTIPQSGPVIVPPAGSVPAPGAQ